VFTIAIVIVPVTAVRQHFRVQLLQRPSLLFRLVCSQHLCVRHCFLPVMSAVMCSQPCPPACLPLVPLQMRQFPTTSGCRLALAVHWLCVFMFVSMNAAQYNLKYCYAQWLLLNNGKFWHRLPMTQLNTQNYFG